MLFAAFALGFGELGDAVAAEDFFEGYAGLVPDLAGNTERRVFYVADAARATPGGANFAVQDLYDIQHGELFRGHGKAISTVRATAALKYVGTPEVTEDLLQKAFRDVLAAGYFCDAERLAALVQCEFYQSPSCILALLC